MDYRVDIEEYEGPLELLLYLVKKEKVDIRNFPISKITAAYLDFINDLKSVDFNLAGNVIKYASLLISIKASSLTEDESSEEIEMGGRRELVRRLEIYNKYRNIALFLRDKELKTFRMFGRPFFQQKNRFKHSVMELKFIGEALIKPESFTPPTSIIWHIERLIENLKRKIEKSGKFKFFHSFKRSPYSEKIGAFFALLELLRIGFAKADQEKDFQEIWVSKK